MLFAAKGILIKLAFAEGVDTLTLLALRMGLSVPVYVAVGVLAYARERQRAVPMPAYPKALLIGVIGYWFSSYADFKGLETLTPQFERLILFTYPLFVLLLGAALFHMPLRWKPLVAFGIAYLGLAVSSWPTSRRAAETSSSALSGSWAPPSHSRFTSCWRAAASP